MQSGGQEHEWWVVAFGLIVIVGLVYWIIQWFKRDVLKKCPSCKKKGVLVRTGEYLKNKRRRRTGEKAGTAIDGRHFRRGVYTTTEYWEAQYQCEGCGHKFRHQFTRSHKSE